MACFGSVTFLPLRPDLSFPSFIALISRSTDFEAFGLYFRPLEAFFELDFFAALFFAALFFAAVFFEAELFFALLLFFTLLFFELVFFELLFFELVFFGGMLSFPLLIQRRLTLQKLSAPFVF